ncbi:MAG: universal stress protein [Haloferacaceae archaeon]
MRTILLPYDGSGPADEAVAYVRETFPDAAVVLLGVVDPVHGIEGVDPDPDGNWHEATVRGAEDLLAGAAETLSGTGVDATAEVRTGAPTATILEAVEEFDADEVVMGSHGRAGVSRLVLGSVAEAVARRASVPVTITR